MDSLMNMTKVMDEMVKEGEGKLLHMVFTRGHCHSLALALHDRIGGDLILGRELDNVNHVALSVDGMALDIEGLSTLEDFAERWGEVEIIPRNLFISKFGDDFHEEPDTELANGAADALIKLHSLRQKPWETQ